MLAGLRSHRMENYVKILQHHYRNLKGSLSWGSVSWDIRLASDHTSSKNVENDETCGDTSRGEPEMV